MDQVLFSISCTTCEARLNVRDTTAIGAIVNCPKCGGMVQVTAPSDWQEPPEQQPPAPEPKTPSQHGTPKPRPKPAAQQKPRVEPKPASRAKETQEETVTAEPSEPKPKQHTPARKAAAATAAAATIAASTATAAAAEPPIAAAAPLQASAPAAVDPLTQWASPAEMAIGRWLLWGAIPAAAIVTLLGAYALFGGGEKPAGPDAPGQPAPISANPDAASAAAVPRPVSELDCRWIPDSAQLVLGLEVAASTASGQFDAILNTAPPLRRVMVDELFQGFGLRPAAVQRLTFSSADLVDWSGTAVAVVTLAEGQSTAALRSVGTGLDWQVGDTQARLLDRPTWSRAFVVLDDRTIVTGEEGLLRQLAEREEKSRDLGLLEPLLRTAPADSDLFLAVDLGQARFARWPLPVQWLDVWPQGRNAWQVIWNLPSALSLSFDRDDFALLELGLLCDGDTVADKVRVAAEQWLPQAESVLAARIDRMATSVQAGDISPTQADRYRLALGGSLAALDSVHLEVVDRCVWLRADCGGNSSAWTTAAADSRPALRTDWLRAAADLDRAAHRRLHGSVTNYQQTYQRAPAGVVDGGVLPPETRFSWIASMLPYLGHETWTADLDTSYSWNSPKNRPVTSRTLDAVQNPAIAARQTDGGFPVTHYVGMAGVGPDAATLSRDDPKAGIFGYRQSRPLTDVPDGASNTIATVGVTNQLGSWAAGGSASVRAFTQQPYINGPDGFGSGQPGGMYVGMADGSARFLSQDIDPTVLEQLATAAGGEVAPPATPGDTDIVRVEPQPADPLPTDPPQPPTDNPPTPDEPIEKPPVVEIERVDPAQQLQIKIPGIAINATPLKQAVRVIEAFGALPVTFDLDTMSTMGVPLDQAVNVHLTDTTVAGALDAVLAPLRLKAAVRDHQMWVTGAGLAQSSPRKVPYSVADLTPSGGTTPDELASWITRLIAPDSWQTAAGQATIKPRGSVLEVTQNSAVHEEIIKFCERLRVARGLSPRSRRPAEQFRLEPRTAQAAAVLQQPVSVNFFRPAPLRRIVDELDRISQAQLAVNSLALAAEGRSPSLPGILSVTQMPLEEALTTLLDPLGLAYRVVDGQTIEVTTRTAMDKRLEREFYPIGDLLDAGQSVPAVIDRVRSDAGPATWDSRGGRGVLFFDEPSRCLIVLQTQKTQADVRQLLDTLR